MNNIRDEIRNYDLSQLNSLREFIQELITSKNNQSKRTVWRVCSWGICHGNFREDEYLKAAAFLLEKSKEIHADEHSCRREKQLEIIGEKVPESEYEDYFNG